MSGKFDDDVPLLGSTQAKDEGETTTERQLTPEERFVRDETPENKKIRFRSINVILLTNLFTGIGFSILLATMWPYLDSFGGTESFLGVLVSGFSFGQLFSSPFWGYWANRYNVAILLYISICMRLCGNLGYTFTHLVPGDKSWFLFEMRLLVGLGAGSMSVCNAYIVEATSPSERTAAVANLAASGALGFIFGPLLGICFGGLDPGAVVGPFHFNYMTMPA